MIGVVKIGGASGNALEPLADEIAARCAAGERWIVVHGASGVMDELCAARGVEVRMVTSPSGFRSRFVGEAERELFREAALSYGARIKDMLAARGAEAEQADPEAVRYVFAKRKDFLRESVNGRVRILRGNYSGTVTKIDPAPLVSLLDAGKIPTVPPLASDEESGLSLNIDGDRLAAQIAGAVGAEALIILSNVPGLMKDIDDPDSLIESGNLAQWDILEHYARGNMKRKLVACREALELSVPRVYLADGRADSPVRNAMEGRSTCLAR
ncbi:MAG: uridylate kinase [Synergistaceae bacterium]|nr:uridylate kinase [Synergistaceae bacterium]